MSDRTFTATRRTPLTSVCLWVHDSYGVPHLVHQVMVLLWLNVRYANRSRTSAGLLGYGAKTRVHQDHLEQHKSQPRQYKQRKALGVFLVVFDHVRGLFQPIDFRINSL